MSILNFKAFVIAAGVLPVLALLILVTPFLIVTSIAFGLFGYIHSITRAARLVPVKVSLDE
jgi:hypothetical protein